MLVRRGGLDRVVEGTCRIWFPQILRKTELLIGPSLTICVAQVGSWSKGQGWEGTCSHCCLTEAVKGVSESFRISHAEFRKRQNAYQRVSHLLFQYVQSWNLRCAYRMYHSRTRRAGEKRINITIVIGLESTGEPSYNRP
jgi:hypothetical protein